MWNLLHFVLNLWMTIFTIADFSFVVVEAAVVTFHPIGERSIVMSVSVCVCVCLSVRDHIFGTTRPIFTPIFMHVTYGCGSVLLWWRSDTLCSS